ncbi:hypothetical protein HQ447_19350, partial [bacterium]|nr:hypothetical protein [bacterium]
MKADLTRDTFDPKNHFRQVLAQQGRVQLDAELNEQAAIAARLHDTSTADIVGDCGGPADSAAFGMSAISGQPGDFLLSAGRYYVDGIQCELEQPVSYRGQPDLPGLPALPAGTHLVYLDVWRRHLTFLDDPRLLETALGGVDTTSRVKNIWQVRTLPVTGATDCSGNFGDFTTLTAASTIRLQARTVPVADAGDPCQMAEGSGYKSLENQLYRVEIHSLLPADQALGVGRAGVWKWSRENASIEVPLKAVDAAQLRITVASLGRDDKLGIRKGDFVELTDDSFELAGRHGDLIEVAEVDQGALTIKLKSAPTRLTHVVTALHPRVRRWEGTANVQAPWLDLEAGIEVRFTATTVARPGDYWMIPARTSAPGSRAGHIEWPETIPGTPDSLAPRGTLHHFCRLGFATVGTAAPVFADCRCLWPSLTGVPRLFYLSGDGQEVMPRAALNPLPQPLIAGIANAHCAEGPRKVRFSVITGGGQVAAEGSAPTAATTEITVNAAGEASCDFHLDRSTYSQQVRAELLDAGGQPVRPAITYNASLSVAREVAYDPGKCKGLAEAQTVQDAISTLASAARFSAVGGDGQDGFSGEILPLSLRVAVMSTCGPVRGASVVFTAREITDASGNKHAQGNFALKRTEPMIKEVKAITGSDGIAEAFWQLPKPALEDTFEAVATVVDFAGLAPEGPKEICFTANLRGGGGATDEDPGAVHIVGVHFAGNNDNTSVGGPIATGAEVAPSQLRRPIVVILDGPLEAATLATPETAGRDNFGIPSNPVCFLTAELPWPLLPSEVSDVNQLQLPQSVLGYRPFILRAPATFQPENNLNLPVPHRIAIELAEDSGTFFARIFELMARREMNLRLLIRLTIKGNFIWRETGKEQLAASGPAGWLDGDSWRVTQRQHPSA